MSEQQKTREINELTQKLSTLKEQKNELDIEVDGWAEKRNKLNEQFKNLRAEIVELKNKRDKLNEEVKKLKQQREKAKTEIHERIEEIQKSNQEIKVLKEKKPSKDLQTLQKEMEDIEWKIQTTTLTLKEEKELVERVKHLETQSSIHRKLQQLYERNFMLQSEIKTLKAESRHCHEKLTETAKKSQEIHAQMIKVIDESKKFKIEADDCHKIFLQTKEKVMPLQREIAEISDRIRQLKGKIRLEEEKEKQKAEDALREKLEAQAREKLRRGEKLTWQEFQLLAEKGITTQD